MEGKFYWLKLKRDFFKRHDIRIVEDMPNGKDYVLFYLKLLCESVDHEGSLRFSDSVPYSAEMLATITSTNIDVVRSAVKVFTELGMMEIFDDGTIYMNEVTKMLGCAADNPNANRQRRFRENQKALKAVIENNSAVIKNNESKRIETDTDKEKDKRVHAGAVLNLYNEICISLPAAKVMNEARSRAIKARLNTYSLQDFETMFRKAEASDFLKGKNNRNWRASFDWLIADRNMARVLEGNYDNRGALDGSYDMMKEWAECGN